MKIKLDDIKALSEKVLSQRGLSIDESRMVVEHLLEAELSERPSHGFIRVARICEALEKAPVKDIVVTRETEISCVLDGGNKPGFVVAYKAMQIATQKAKNLGISIVGGFNSDNIGILGFYSRRIAEYGFASIMTANSPAKIPPWGGVEPVMGTNPLCIGVPTSELPIVIDFASSKTTFGDVLLAAKKGELFPEGYLLDMNGKPTVFPGDVRSGGIGAILSIAEHKGAGLALLLEILAGPMVNAKAGRKAATDGGWGFLMIVFNPELLSDTDQYLSKLDKLVEEVKSTKRAPGFDEISLPGEKTSANLQKNKNLSIIEMPETAWKELLSFDKTA